MKRRGVAIAGLAAAAWMLSACHSNRIVATVENRTGGAITLLEVDYPSASFGVDALPEGANYPYRFKVQSSGVVKVQYTAADGHTIRQITGPELREGQEGTLTIVLRPDGTAEFQPELTPRD